MQLIEAEIDELLRDRLKLVAYTISKHVSVTSVRNGDGLRIQAHSRKYVELVLRFIAEQSAFVVRATTQRALYEAGLKAESNVSVGWNKPRGEAGSRWIEMIEVGIDPAVSQDLVRMRLKEFEARDDEYGEPNDYAWQGVYVYHK